MLNKIRDIKAARGDGGFTLNELLVVVVILVALAAIAIPVFLNQRAKADEAAQKSTVSSIATFISTGIANGEIAATGTTISGTSLDAGENGNIAVPANVEATWNSIFGTFCVELDADDPADFASIEWSYSNESGAVVAGACA